MPWPSRVTDCVLKVGSALERDIQTDGAAVLKERLPKDVRLKATCSSGADDDHSDRVLLRVIVGYHRTEILNASGRDDDVCFP